MLNNKPIFIVGTPRSGTTLISAFLNNHSNLDCGPETHFFCNLTRRKEKEILEKKFWPYKALEFLCSLKIEGEYVYKQFSLTEEEIFAFLSKFPPRISYVLESLTYLHALKNNKRRWIEKTPDHLKYIGKIKKIFPHSKIVRVVRDPRNVALSLLKVPWGDENLIMALVRCIEDDIISNRFADYFFTIKFEDCLLNTQTSLEDLCIFIEEKYENSLLNFYKESRSLVSPREWWKKNVFRPLDPSRCYVWKEEMLPDDKIFASYFSLNLLRKYNYEFNFKEPKETIIVFPLTNVIANSLYEVFVRLAKKNIRIVGCRHLECLKSLIEQENPDKISFFDPIDISNISNAFSSKARIQNTFLFLRNLIFIRRKKIPIFYCQLKEISKKLGRAEALVIKFVKKLAQKYEF